MGLFTDAAAQSKLLRTRAPSPLLASAIRVVARAMERKGRGPRGERAPVSLALLSATRAALLAIHAAAGDAAAALPSHLDEALDACDGDANDAHVKAISSWLIANPYELRKCRDAQAMLKSSSQILLRSFPVEAEDVVESLEPGACVERTLPLADTKAWEILGKMNGLRAAKRTAVESLERAGFKCQAVDVCAAALQATVRVCLANGQSSAAATSWAGRAADAAIAVLQQMAIRAVLWSGSPSSVSRLIGKGGKSVANVIRIVQRATDKVCREATPCLQNRVFVRVSESQVHVLVVVAPRDYSRGQTAMSLEAVAKALRALGDEAELLVRSWIAQTLSFLECQDRLYKAKRASWLARGGRRGDSQQCAELIDMLRDWPKEQRARKLTRDQSRDRRGTRRKHRQIAQQGLPRHRRDRGNRMAGSSRFMQLAFETAVDRDRPYDRG